MNTTMDATKRLGTVAVAGATGGIGEGATRALLQRADRVIALGRSAQRLQELQGRIAPGEADRLILVQTDVTALDSAAVTATIAQAAPGPIDGALITIGTTPTPGPGSVLDIPDEDVRAAIEVNELGGLRALRALVPATRPGGAVVTILGYSGEIPFPGNPLMGSTNAALRSLVSTLAVQLEDSGPRIYGLVVGVVRTRARQLAGIDNPRWLTGEMLGDYSAALVSGQVERPGSAFRYYLSPTAGPGLTPRH